MWEGINSCRIYSHVLVFSDLTPLDGCQIPLSIYEVRERLRDSVYPIPFQDSPTNSTIQSWQYFIRHITLQNTRLITPLGTWIKSPFQTYKYAMDVQSKLVYKKVKPKLWDIYIPLQTEH